MPGVFALPGDALPGDGASSLAPQWPELVIAAVATVWSRF